MLNKEDILALAWGYSEGSGKRYTFTEQTLFDFLEALNKEPFSAQDEQHPEAEGVGVVAEAYSHRSRDSMKVTVMNIQQIGRLRDGDKLVRQLDHIAALSAVTDERDRLREDAERISFIEREWFYSPSGDSWSFSYREDWEESGATLRDAIDAAMAREEENKTKNRGLTTRVQ